MSKRSAELFIEDILFSLEKIESYTKNMTAKKFYDDFKTIDAVVRNLSIIGEASSNIPKEMKLKYPEVPWVEIIGMRNKVVHEYFGVDEEILWKTIKEDLPVFRKQIQNIKRRQKSLGL
ncbi:MAG TPA: hypothetical protein DCS28_02770 [Candidatus Moranbacteria bacterium]|nr:hypothetical protein [Candidatus Moranbacteria bacterium]HAT74939.1 hypothetical protein [Candidatus Moranbacteria bacterium]